MIKSIKQLAHWGSITLVALSLIACSSGSNTAATSTLSGTAASGLATVGTVAVSGVAGDPPPAVDIGTDGSFLISVAGLTPPFILMSTDGAGAELFSYADAANIIANITPLTNSMMFLAGDSVDPATLFATWGATGGPPITPADVENAIATVNANIATVLTANGLDPMTLDFVTAPFDVGVAGLDMALDDIAIDLTNGLMFSLDGVLTLFDGLIDISAFDIGGIIGGGAGGGTNGGTGGGTPGVFVPTGNVSLTISGTSGGFTIPAVPGVTVPAASVPTASQLSLIESDFANGLGAAGSVSGVTVELLNETTTSISFRIAATVTVDVPGLAAIPSSFDLTYTYTQI